jgi:hypothetical protein
MIKSRRVIWVEHVACVGMMNAYMILVEKPEGKNPVGRPRHRWKDHFGLVLREI